MIAFFVRLAALLVLLSAGAALAGEAQDGSCDGKADPNFICGPVNAEDLNRIPGTDWVIASRMAGRKDAQGMFYLLNAGDHSWRPIAIDEIEAVQDRTTYPKCPGKPTTASFSGHGIALKEGPDGLTLFAVSHGQREGVEVFNVDAKADIPTLRWVGCVPAPSGVSLNGVAPLPEGGFVVTEFFDTTNKNWGRDLFTGKPTGVVLEWQPQQGWGEIAGTHLSGPNGIVVSPDGKALFVAEWGAKKLHRIARGDAAESKVITLNFNPDNLLWDNDGKLLLTGQAASLRNFAGCAMGDSAVCAHPYKVIKVDPATLTSEVIIDVTNPTVFGSGTTALDLGSEYWIGTWRGNRIARMAK